MYSAVSAMLCLVVEGRMCVVLCLVVVGRVSVRVIVGGR